MATLSLNEVLSNYSSLSSKSLELLEELAVRESFRRGEFITRTGLSNHKEYLVLEGVCRSCLFSPEGEDNTLSFFVAGSVISPYVIRVQNGVSVLNIQASTDLELISFNANIFEQLMLNNIEIRAFGNEVLKRELFQMFQKETGLASLTAKERLINFRNSYPMLENQVPHSEIASFIGITTISLSRIRNELMH